jgi:hypothetical protein
LIDVKGKGPMRTYLLVAPWNATTTWDSRSLVSTTDPGETVDRDH